MQTLPKISNFPSFPNGLSIGEIPVSLTNVGKTLWVDSGLGSDSGPGSLRYPYATISYAISQATANNGDVILVMPGHAETLTGAGDITLNKAGVAIIFLGQGADRGTITFGTATTASIVVSAASCSIINAVGVAGFDALANPIHVQAADFTLDIEWRDGSSTVEAERVLLTTAAADRLKAKIVYRGYTAGNATVNVARLVGVNDGDLDIDFYGVASTSVVEFHTTACTNIKVKANIYNSGTTDGSKNVIDTVTGSTWSANIWDATAGASFSGGSGAALASDDISTISTLVGTVDSATTDNLHGKVGTDTELADRSIYDILNGGGPAAAAAAADPANDVSLYAVCRRIFDTLVGTAGIASFPASAAPANAVSMAEVLRSVYDRQLGDGTDSSTNSVLGKKVTRAAADIIDGTTTNVFTVAGGRILLTHLEAEVTTAGVDATNSNAKFTMNPTVGTDRDLCANLDVISDELGSVYTISGVASDALQGGTGGGAGAMSIKGVILPEGTIDFVSSADAGTGGALLKLEAFYIPLDDGATLASA